jgi:hypothetical protein
MDAGSTPSGVANPGAKDAFISHAGEDKLTVAEPLARALSARGWKVWLDKLELTVGDSLNQRISTALARSRFGIVILSKAFFSKHWPQRERLSRGSLNFEVTAVPPSPRQRTFIAIQPERTGSQGRPVRAERSEPRSGVP